MFLAMIVLSAQVSIIKLPSVERGLLKGRTYTTSKGEAEVKGEGESKCEGEGEGDNLPLQG
jgi:hypothetical protein